MTTIRFFASLRDEFETDGSKRIISMEIPVKNEVIQDRNNLKVTLQTALVQLGVGGMVATEGDRLRLVPGSRLHELWVEIPSIIIADAAQTATISNPQITE